MRTVTNSVVFAALLAGAALACGSSAAMAADHDGIWSVIIITEKGDCDRAYRYSLKVEHGRVSYAGDGSFKMSGTVAPGGAVRVSIRLGDKGADGTGRLSGSSGSGHWHGSGPNSHCAGRWEAEKH